MILKKIFCISVFSQVFFTFQLSGEDITEIDPTNEYLQENIYEKNKRWFNNKGHLSISSGGINSITLSPLYGMLGLATSSTRIYL